MYRRDFPTGLGAGLAGGRAPGHHKTAAAAAHLSTYVANVEEMLGPDPLPVEPGASLLLQRLPDHSYDPTTIAVTTAEGRQLGYLPSVHARILAPLLDAGAAAFATVAEAKNWPRPCLRIDVLVGPKFCEQE